MKKKKFKVANDFVMELRNVDSNGGNIEVTNMCFDYLLDWHVTKVHIIIKHDD